MELKHIDTTAESRDLVSRPPFVISCNNGGHMAKVMHTVRHACNTTLKDNSGLIVWDSRHHEILLWFESPKFESLLILKGVL